MALDLPSRNEQIDILRSICHAENEVESQYETFIRFYRATVCKARARDEIITIDRPAFQSHADLCSVLTRLNANPRATRQAIQDTAFPGACVDEKERGIKAVTKVGFLVDIAAKDNHSKGYCIGDYFPAKWEADESFLAFLGRAFPTSATTSFYATHHKRNLKAWKLQKRYGITFVPTSDIVQHLVFDREARQIRIFQQTAFLKAQLQYTAAKVYDMGLEESINGGTLPPQLLFETLCSIYDVLFPVHDKKSSKFVKTLIRKHGFSRDLSVFDGHIREFPEEFEYVYWGERLTKLQEIISNPPPANKMIRWFERHTTERNALTVAILGVFLAALFGFLSFVVGLAQLVVAILALKNPPT